MGQSQETKRQDAGLELCVLESEVKLAFRAAFVVVVLPTSPHVSARNTCYGRVESRFNDRCIAMINDAHSITDCICIFEDCSKGPVVVENQPELLSSLVYLGFGHLLLYG